jgi:hypothetical protein
MESLHDWVTYRSEFYTKISVGIATADLSGLQADSERADACVSLESNILLQRVRIAIAREFTR